MKDYRILNFIITKCADCPYVDKRNGNIAIINGVQHKQVDLYRCGKLIVQVDPNKIHPNCILNKMNLEEAIIIEE